MFYTSLRVFLSYVFLVIMCIGTSLFRFSHENCTRTVFSPPHAREGFTFLHPFFFFHNYLSIQHPIGDRPLVPAPPVKYMMILYLVDRTRRQLSVFHLLWYDTAMSPCRYFIPRHEADRTTKGMTWRIFWEHRQKARKCGKKVLKKGFFRVAFAE